MDQMPTDGFRERPVWLVGAAALVLAQIGLGLATFGIDRSWAAVLDDRPILSGRHPLHLYHGTLGASSFHDRGVATCYDPHFQAGYPKTPVFDGGSRPAELFLFLGGGTYSPAAYKLGMFALLALVPVAFVAAARGAGVPAGAAILSGCGGILLGWSATVRQMILEGQLDLFGAGLAAVVLIPWLARYARTMGVDAWIVLAGTGILGWYFQPLVWVGLSPVILAYYLVFAPRLGPAWHLGLAGVGFVGIAPNAWWLSDWGKYWWLRQPSAGDDIPIPDWRTAAGSFSDYAPLFDYLPGGIALVFCGVAGLICLRRTGHKTSAWLLLLAATFTVMLARFAEAWTALPPTVPVRIMVLAAGFLVPPTAYTAWLLLKAIRAQTIAIPVALVGLLIVGWVDGSGKPLARSLGIASEPLSIGFSPEQKHLIGLLERYTTPEARILWDEAFCHRPGWNWSALLPLYVDRAFLGGLDPESGVEHSYCAMCSPHLTGRSLSEWSDADLMEFCRWYNVGWVVARSPLAIERWGRLPKAVLLARTMEDGQPVALYKLERTLSFLLNGSTANSAGASATWESADTRRVILTNVIPFEGEVQLSLHMLKGLRVSPSYIIVEPMPDPTCRDPVDHVKLRMPSRVPRLTLTWENP